MFGNAFGWPHLIVILVVILLLFGAPKLPGLAKSLGQSMRIFRKEVSTMKDEKAADDRRPQATVVEEEAPVASAGAGPSTPDPATGSAPASSEPGGNSSQPKP